MPHQTKHIAVGLITSLIALTMMTGCELFSASGSDDEGFEIAQSAQPRQSEPDVSDDNFAELIGGNTEFAFDLYHQLSAKEGNNFYSPLSISLALAMTYGGARGETDTEMASALNFTLPQAQLHPAFNKLDLDLNARDEANEGFELSLVNAIWGQQGYQFMSDYLDLLAINYGAAMRLLDFVNAPDESREVINDWVSDETNERIQNLLPPGSVDTLTRLVLTNAIYFNADWLHPFPKESTFDGPFTLLDGSESQATFMSNTLSFNYAEINDTIAVELPYKGEETSMLILMPDRENFSAFEDSLNAELFSDFVNVLERSYRQLIMPKFSFTSEYNLVSDLQELGMERAFIDGEADFSGINGMRDFIIKGVFHKAFVAVDEKGTEAAAATGVVIGPTSAPIEEEVIIDQPFVFVIRDRVTGTLLFVGRVLDPGVE